MPADFPKDVTESSTDFYADLSATQKGGPANTHRLAELTIAHCLVEYINVNGIVSCPTVSASGESADAAASRLGTSCVHPAHENG